MNTTDQSIFECWAVVEVFGHQQLSGKVTEQTIAGQGFIRVDVPDLPDQPGFTRMFGPGAIYSIIPTTQEIATAYAVKNVDAPIKSWQLGHPQLPSNHISQSTIDWSNPDIPGDDEEDDFQEDEEYEKNEEKGIPF